MMKDKGVDAVIVLDELNQHYLSNFAFTDGFLLITHHKAYLVTDFRYYEMALNSANKSFEILTPANRAEFLDKALADENGNNLTSSENTDKSLDNMNTDSNGSDKNPFSRFIPSCSRTLASLRS